MTRGLGKALDSEQAREQRRTAVSLAVIWACMGFFALQASYLGLSYIFGDLDAFDPLFYDKYTAHLGLVRTHGVAGAGALCLGLVAFVRQTHRWKLHTLVGRTYAACVLVAGITALPMAAMAEGGVSSRLAFFLQAVFWLFTGSVAFGAARRRRFRLHRRFMVRNYALTYSAVVSRLLLNGLQEAGLGFSDIYPIVSWTWVTGLAVGEWWLWYYDRLRPPTPQASGTQKILTSVSRGVYDRYR